jgi:hypothetical protein
MSRKIFVNMPVADLARSRDFFGKLGFTFNDQFSDDTAACLVISDAIYAMLLTHEKFQSFTPKAVADAHTVSEVLLALSADSREEVDRLADTALANGGTKVREPADHGFMYERSVADADGHIWEFFFMNMAQMPAA